MTAEESPKKTGKTKALLSVEQARAAILEKIQKGVAKGATALATKAVLTANQAAFDEALAALENEGVVLVDRGAAKPKYYLKEYAPSHRKSILAKLEKAGTKGAPSLYTNAASATVRAAIEQDAAALESEGRITVDRLGAKPKYYLREFAPQLPNLEEMCARLERFATANYPEIFSELELKKQLAEGEAKWIARSIYWLESQGDLVRLRRGKAIFFASASALRSALVEKASAKSETASALESPASSGLVTSSADVDAGGVRKAYRTLVEQSGFPSVKIAALQRESGAPLDALHWWLMEEYRQGRAVLSFGDWSLSDEATRAAAIELRGDHYLLVKLQE